MPIAIITLFLAAFCIGTTEFVIAGLLPEISNDLDISIPIAGYLISAYALGVAVGGPIITLSIARAPRKLNLLFLMAIFIAGHVWCATAQGYQMLMVGRLTVALSHGSFFGVASVVAVTIVPEDRRGTAIAWLFAGITVANIVGVPIGTAIGNWLGWRATFWVVGSVAILVFVAMIFTLPKDPTAVGIRPGIRAQISALTNQKVLLSYLVFTFSLIGFWALFTFIAPFLLDVAGISQQKLPFFLFLFGGGATFGTIIGGRLANQHLTRTLAVAYPVQVFAFIIVALGRADLYLVGALLFAFGAIMFLPASALVNRVITSASEAPDLASTLIASAANIGIAVGAVVGAQAVIAGLSYSQLPLIGILFATLAAATMLFSLRLERRAVERIVS